MQISVPFASYPNLRFFAVIAGVLGTVSNFTQNFCPIFTHRLSLSSMINYQSSDRATYENVINIFCFEEIIQWLMINVYLNLDIPTDWSD